MESMHERREHDDTQRLSALLTEHPPFDSLDPEAREELVEAADLRRYAAGELVFDAFTDPSPSVYIVVEGRVGLWHDRDRVGAQPDETMGVGDVFGFSALLTERTVGPRVVAVTATVVARLPEKQAYSAFATRRGAAFLARTLTQSRRLSPVPAFNRVDDLLHYAPLVLSPTDTVREAAVRMTRERRTCAVIPLPGGEHALLTDGILRRRVVAEGLPDSVPVTQVAATPAPHATTGEVAAEVLIRILASDTDTVVVTDRAGRLQGMVTLRDFALSPVNADVTLHDQLRRSSTTDELTEHARHVPDLLSQLLARGLSSGSVIAVYSGVIDTLVRRAITLIIPGHEGLTADAFTWMALGSNGRREAVLSSDVDSAVAFADDTTPAQMEAYRAVFREIDAILAAAGLSGDDHGATAHRPAFSRTHAEWRAAARQWLADPVERQGAMMTSLLTDGRPIHGDPGLSAVALVFRDIREHPGTLRLLLQDALAVRPRVRGTRDALLRRYADFDIKHHALLPLVNLARWVALSVQSPALSTPERLRAAAGSSMLPTDQAHILIEAFEVLQRLRLRYQLIQYDNGHRPTDRLTYQLMSPLDRSVVAQAVREISNAQRRLANVSAYTDTDQWMLPEST